MTFKKIGEESLIIDFFDDNGKEKFCPICGKKLNLISIGEDKADFICETCDIEKSTKVLN